MKSVLEGVQKASCFKKAGGEKVKSGQKKVAKNRQEAESNREGNGGEYSASVCSLLGNNLGAAHCGCVTYSKLLHWLPPVYLPED